MSSYLLLRRHARVAPQMLWLHDNRIGDAGVLALAESARAGALPNVGTLSLDHNRISTNGIKALVDAVAAGALPR